MPKGLTKHGSSINFSPPFGGTKKDTSSKMTGKEAFCQIEALKGVEGIETLYLLRATRPLRSDNVMVENLAPGTTGSTLEVKAPD